MNHLIIPGFCKAKLLEGCLEHISHHKLPENTQLIVTYNHFPVDKEANLKRFQELTQKHNALLIDTEVDRGLHGSFNFALNHIKPEPHDIIMGVDPDDRPTDCWQAMVDVFNAEPEIDVVACAFPLIHRYATERPRQYLVRAIANHVVYELKGIEMFMCASWRQSFINKCEGFQQTYKYYGGLEAAMYGASGGTMKLVYLTSQNANSMPIDREDPELFEKSYREYKSQHVANTFPGSYEEFLNAQRR